MPARKKQRIAIVACCFFVIFAVVGVFIFTTDLGNAAFGYVWSKMNGGYTVADRQQHYGSAVAARLKDKYVSKGITYPPAEVAFVAFKDVARLDIYARDADTATWTHIHSYPILGLSGTLGPKLREGDGQVPEGMYEAEFLNANSRFHLSIRLNYPNAYDRAHGQADGRTKLGSDIMIHGTSQSVGCLAMGNEAAEDLFILTALVGKEHVRIVVAPTDFRMKPITSVPIALPWVSDLYGHIAKELAQFPLTN